YTFVTFYRRDWLDKVGIKDYPATFQEWLDLYAAIKEAGLSDYPAGGTKVAGAGVDQNYGYRTYPQDELTWATTGDYNIPALSTEAQKTLIKRANVLYNEGYLDPDWYTKDGSKGQEDFIAGKAFSWSGYISSNMDVLNAFYEQNPDGDLDVVVAEWSEDNDPLTGYSCAAYRPNNVFGAMLGFAWDATADEILAAEMYLEWLSQPENLFTMQWGIEGINFEYVDGQPVSLTLEDMTYQQGHNNNVDYWMLITASKSLGTIEEDVKAVSPVGLPEDFTEDIIANYYGQLAMYQAGQAQSDCLFAQAIEAEAEYATSLQELYATYRTQLTNCPTDEFDALYDELSKAYLDAGYQEVIDGRAEAFNAGLTTRLPQ
ncbi:MAG: extracellular solute-binding protein, partial [Lachnospiraceae bacterium]